MVRRSILQVLLRTLRVQQQPPPGGGRDGSGSVPAAATLVERHMSGLEPLLVALSRGDSQLVLVRDTSRELLALIRGEP